MNIPLGRKPGAWALMTAIAVVLAATLTPGSGETLSTRCALFSLTCGDTWAVDLVLNLALFLPVGITAGWAGLDARRSLLLGLGLSLSVEALQATLVPGRDPSLRDLIANTTGAAAGALAFSGRSRLLTPTAPGAQALTLLASGGLSLWLLTAGLLLRPSLPSSVWYGQHRAELGGFDRFDGEFIAATIGDEPLPSGPIDPAVVERQQAQGSIAVEATFRGARHTTERLAPIVSVFDGEQRKIVLVGQLGSALAVSPRLRAEDWGLQAIVARFPVPSPMGPATATISASYAEGVITVSGTDGDGNRVLRSQDLGPADWWRLTSPRPIPLSSGTASAVTVFALLLCFFPLGWLGAAGSFRPGSGRWLGLLASAVPASIALLPIPLGLPVARLSDWAGALAGWLIGWWMRRNGPPSRWAGDSAQRGL